MGHLRENGFSVMTKDLGDAELSTLKARHGVARELAGCHTAEIEGYVIEGHVHAREIVRLLRALRPIGRRKSRLCHATRPKCAK